MPSRFCPTCRTKLIRILYGMPSGEAAEAQERGELQLAGCEVVEGQPQRWCPSCEAPVGEVDGVLVMGEPQE